MTPERKAQIAKLAAEAKTRADKATEGPWIAGPCDPEAFKVIAVVESDMWDTVVIHAPVETFVDDPAGIADFMAAARTDVPQLAAAVEELVAEVERLAAENEALLNQKDIKYLLAHDATAQMNVLRHVCIRDNESLIPKDV